VTIAFTTSPPDPQRSAINWSLPASLALALGVSPPVANHMSLRLHHKGARFRQVNKEQPHVHHDALELHDREIVLVTKLLGGQHATVLQMPATEQEISAGKDSHEAVIEMVPADW
jgi:hypothetical protein